MKKRLVVYISVFQLLIITAIIFSISRKTESVLSSEVTATPLKFEEIVFMPAKGLEYFYQLKKNTTTSLTKETLSNLGYPDGSEIIYRINSDGINALKDFEIEKAKNTFRIVALGDSFTFGTNVNTKDNYPTQLENLLNAKCSDDNKYEVLNLGVGGYDFQFAVEHFRQKGQKYDPDLVIWLLISSDFLRLTEMTQANLAKIKDTKGQEIYDWRQLVDANAVANFKAIEELGGEVEVLKLQKEHASEISKYYKDNLVMTTFQDTPQNYKDFLHDFSKTRQGTYVHDKIPNLYTDHKYYVNDLHPSKEGHELMANNIFNYLKEKNLIPCDE